MRNMKRRVFLAFMLFMGVWAAGAQTCTLRFTGTDKQQHYLKLDHVKIFNKTQLWQEVIYWPDTTLVLGGTGVEEYDIAKGFRIMQNTPNPFSGSTEFAITLPQERSVLIEIFDISGKKVISKSFGMLEAGTHIFNVTLQTPNTYIANATIKDGQMTIKMINEGHGAANEINYGGMRSLTEDYHTKGDRYVEAYPFASGDMMEYTGYASIGGTEYQSVTVQQKQYGSETISLRFSQLGLPEVTTLNADNITSYTSRLNGNVTSLGGLPSVLRGFCWTKTTDGTPTISDNIVQEWGTTGEYSKTISGLEPGESYVVRAYATNAIGTNYGQQKVFTTAPVNPIVVTKNITNITGTSANVGGEISSTGGAAITARGVCWSTTQNPTINGNHTTDGNGFGSFVSLISDLEPGTTYHVRAYATNSAGTGYGAQKNFTTSFICGTSTVTDVDGNVYNTVQIGEQCWMRENLRTTHYADGTAIPSHGSNYSDTDPYYYNYASSGIALEQRGLLYNWPAAMKSGASSAANPSGVQGICPDGWHLPSDAEWTQLIDYVKSQSQYTCGGDSSYIAKALASTTGWKSSTNTCAVGNDPSSNNATSFGAVPAGGYHCSNINSFGTNAYFQSSTEYSSSYGCIPNLSFSRANVLRGNPNKDYGYSVRCVKD